MIMVSLVLRFNFQISIIGYQEFWRWGSYDISLLAVMISLWLIPLAMKINELGSEVILTLTGILVGAASLFAWASITPEARLLLSEHIDIQDYLVIFIPIIYLAVQDSDILYKRAYPRRYVSTDELAYSGLHIAFSLSIIIMLEILTSIAIYSSLTGKPNVQPNTGFVLTSLYMIIFSLFASSIFEVTSIKKKYRHMAVMYALIVLIPIVIIFLYGGLLIEYIIVIVALSIILSIISLFRTKNFDSPEKIGKIIIVMMILATMIVVYGYNRDEISIEQGEVYRLNSIEIRPIEYRLDLSPIRVSIDKNVSDYWYKGYAFNISVNGEYITLSHKRYARGLIYLESIHMGEHFIYSDLVTTSGNSTRYNLIAVKYPYIRIYTIIMPLLSITAGVFLGYYGMKKISESRDRKPKKIHTFQKE
jgi:hypothetical protein